MPNYSYCCSACDHNFEMFFYIKDYVANPRCPKCRSIKTHRDYIEDVLTQSASVKKSDSELKTIGDLAMRNSERMSEDQKQHLYMKHNSYKEDPNPKPLPKGMERAKKGQKVKWPGSTGVTKRRKKL